MTNYLEEERLSNFNKLLKEKKIDMVSKKFTNARDHYDFKCKVCGTVFNKTGQLIKSQEYPCPSCTVEQQKIRHRQKVQSKMDTAMVERGLIEYFEILEYPELMKYNAKFKHKPCGNTITTSIGNLYRVTKGIKGISTGCEYCSGRHTYTEEEIKEYVSVERPNYTYIDNFMSDKSHLMIIVKHNICNEIKTLQFNYFMRGNGCSSCTLSNGVEIITYELDNLNISYEMEKRFEGMLQYAYDLYLPDLNILIEYDGRYHHEPIDKWGGESRLEIVRKNDTIKNDLAKEISIPLIRIPYTLKGSEIINIIGAIADNNSDNYKHLLV